MSIDFPTYEDKQILTPEDLNDFVQDLQDKFTAGISAADIQWPLLAENNLEMDIYEIIGGRKIWSIVNAAEYDTLDAALSAASGGICFIPPDTTIEASSVTIPGNGTAIIGCGQSSVIRASSGATGSLLKNSTSGVTAQLVIANLQLDGNNESCDGLELSGAQYCMISNVQFEDFAGKALLMTADGATEPERIVISNCLFKNNDYHVYIEACRDVVIGNCHLRDSDDASIVATGSVIRRLSIHDNVIQGADAESIQILGGAGAYATDNSEIIVADNVIDGTGMTDSVPCIEVGSSAGRMQHVSITGNQITGATSDAIKTYARYVVIDGNNCDSAGQHGVNCTSSAYATITGNNLRNATNVGILASNGGTGIVIASNNVLDCATSIQPADESYHFGNAGHIGGAPAAFYSSAATPTIPANAIKSGDVVEIWWHADVSAGSGDMDIFFDGQNVGTTKSSTSTGDRQVRTTLVVTNTTAGWHIYNGFTDNRTDTVGLGTFTGVDLTTALDLTKDTSGLTTGTTRCIVKLWRAEEI
jgi:hypothetical protein